MHNISYACALYIRAYGSTEVAGHGALPRSPQAPMALLLNCSTPQLCLLVGGLAQKCSSTEDGLSFLVLVIPVDSRLS